MSTIIQILNNNKITIIVIIFTLTIILLVYFLKKDCHSSNDYLQKCDTSHCPFKLTNNGVCNTQTGVCSCNTGYSGIKCELKTKSVLPYMTANNKPYGYKISASSYYNSSTMPYMAFDSNNNTFWSSINIYASNTGIYIGDMLTSINKVGNVKGEWIQLEVLDEPFFVFTYSYTSTGTYRGMNTFYLLYSDNGKDWDIADYQKGIISSVITKQLYKLKEPKYAKYWRFVIINIGNEGVSSYRTMVEIPSITFNL